MKIGFANMFSFRPHVEHLMFLSKIMEQAGHEVFYLTCDSSVSNCYSRALRGSSKAVECSKCILGGVRSYAKSNVATIKRREELMLTIEELDNLTWSSSCTLTRVETNDEQSKPEVVKIRESLHAPTSDVYESAINWIDEKKLEAVICFNGRMDITRAITFACEKKSVPYITHERTWFGDGLHLTPNANCLSIKALGEMVRDFDDKPLALDQARLAGKLIGERFLQRNTLEWRLYNKNPEPVVWPTKSKGRRILVLPSSKNEFAGHDEWKCGWTDNTKALDDFFEAFGVQPEDVVVRFHPNWAENIGKVSGEKPLKLYTDWARRSGVHYISSQAKANTYDLIQQADIVVLNGGSSAVEAGACGKQVICLGASSYDKAGFLRVFMNKEDMYQDDALTNILPVTVITKTLRYVYLRANRFPQYVNFVKALKTTKYKYFKGSDPQRIIDMLLTGEVAPDDGTYSNSEVSEDEVVQLLQKQDWAGLINLELKTVENLEELAIQRRFGFRWVDQLREKVGRGDR